MKPLPLLCTLCAATALFGGLLLTQKQREKNERALSPLPAPLPPSFSEIEEELVALPEGPLLEDDLTPAPELVDFAEQFTGLSFQEVPVFKPVALDGLVDFVSHEMAESFPPERWQELTELAAALGAAPEFQPLAQSLITAVAGEVRGIVSRETNLILSDFNPESPPEQTALVGLLVQRLLLESLPTPAFESSSVDQILAHQLFIEAFVFLAEDSFRQTLPAHPPSLHENIREAILVGLPDFIYELTTFGEFHLAERLSQPEPHTALAEILARHRDGMSLSRLLLAYPEAEEAALTQNFYQLGPLVFHLLTLKNASTSTSQSLARSLLGDELDKQDESLIWTLTFRDATSTVAAAQSLKTALPFQDTGYKVQIVVEGSTLKLVCTQSHE